MKQFIATLLLISLVGCSTAPVIVKFPEVPDGLKVACPDLKKMTDTQKLSQVLSTVTENYEQYKECKIKVDIWNEWYTRQKKIFESVK